MSTNQSTGANNITQFGMAVSDDDFVNCTGIDRNLWVTITRIAMPAPSLKSEETAEARLLQAVQDRVDGLLGAAAQHHRRAARGYHFGDAAAHDARTDHAHFVKVHL